MGEVERYGSLKEMENLLSEEDEADMISLRVIDTHHPTHYDVSVRRTAHVTVLKMKLASLSKIVSSQQVLAFNGRILHDDTVIQNISGIQNGAALRLSKAEKTNSLLVDGIFVCLYCTHTLSVFL